MTKHTIEVELFDQDGNSETHRLLALWEICGACEGHGRSSAYLGAFTCDDMDEAGPEFMEDYMAGHYDRSCEHCNGAGKISVIDRDRAPAAILAKIDEAAREEAEYQAMVRAERRMGA
jgi:DnaJ-class molecular chaperone